MMQNRSTPKTLERVREIAAGTLIIALSLTFGGCFQVLHILDFRPDGGVRVKWRFIRADIDQKSIDEAFGKTRRTSKSAPGSGGKKSEMDFGRAAFRNIDGLREGLRAQASNARVTVSRDAHEWTLLTEFTLDRGVRLARETRFRMGLPLTPDYDAAKGRLVFPLFPGMFERGGKKEDKKRAEQMFGIALSTGRYQMLLSGVKIRRAYLRPATGKDLPLTLIPLGESTMINFPFSIAVAMHMEGMLKKKKTGLNLVLETGDSSIAPGGKSAK